MEVPAVTLLEHYIAYITSPEIILTLAIVIFPIVYLGYTIPDVKAASASEAIPGCFSLGLSRRSNLERPPATDSAPNVSGRVKALFTYPIESCRGVELGVSQVEPTGLKYDGLFCLASKDEHQSKEADSNSDADWHCLRESDCPNLSQIKLELWIPRPATDTRGERSSQHSSKDLRERSRPRGSTQVNKLERGAHNTRLPKSDFSEHGGCLVIRFQHMPKFDPFGVQSANVAIHLPLEPSVERMQAKGYTQERVVINSKVERASNLSVEVADGKLDLLKTLLGIKGRLAIFQRGQKRRMPQVRLCNVTEQNLTNLQRARCNLYATSLHAIAPKEGTAIGLIGRRLARTSEGLVETEANYAISKEEHSTQAEGEGIRVLKPLFERGLIRVGDEIRLLDE